ncbi:MAG: hypothetical protein HYT76_02570 [Deltaproteobacteria bacterium]|nr:hypothetical protein [Deltaproteobacteria bacterium]
MPETSSLVAAAGGLLTATFARTRSWQLAGGLFGIAGAFFAGFFAGRSGRVEASFPFLTPACLSAILLTSKKPVKYPFGRFIIMLGFMVVFYDLGAWVGSFQKESAVKMREDLPKTGSSPDPKAARPLRRSFIPTQRAGQLAPAEDNRITICHINHESGKVLLSDGREISVEGYDERDMTEEEWAQVRPGHAFQEGNTRVQVGEYYGFLGPDFDAENEIVACGKVRASRTIDIDIAGAIRGGSTLKYNYHKANEFFDNRRIPIHQGQFVRDTFWYVSVDNETDLRGPGVRALMSGLSLMYGTEGELLVISLDLDRDRLLAHLQPGRPIPPPAFSGNKVGISCRPTGICKVPIDQLPGGVLTPELEGIFRELVSTYFDIDSAFGPPAPQDP